VPSRYSDKNTTRTAPHALQGKGWRMKDAAHTKEDEDEQVLCSPIQADQRPSSRMSLGGVSIDLRGADGSPSASHEAVQLVDTTEVESWRCG